MNIGATEFCFALKKEKSIFKNKNKVLFKQEKLTSIKKCINKQASVQKLIKKDVEPIILD